MKVWCVIETDVKVGDCFLYAEYDSSKPTDKDNALCIVRVISDTEVIMSRTLTNKSDFTDGVRITKRPIACLLQDGDGELIKHYALISSEAYNSYKEYLLKIAREFM